jgi:hypothetical protein
MSWGVFVGKEEETTFLPLLCCFSILALLVAYLSAATEVWVHYFKVAEEKG